MTGRATRTRGRRRFWAILGIIVVAGTALRVGYMLTVTRHDKHLYDATYYTLQAWTIVDGDGYVDPFALRNGEPAGPAADHPPLIVLALLPAALIGDDDASVIAMRITTMLFGLAAIVMTGLLGRRAVGDAVGLVAAGVAAVSPNFWLNDSLVMSESLATFLTATSLLLAFRAREVGSWGRYAALGAVCALAALTRSELVLLAPLLILPLAFRGRDRRAFLSRAVVGRAVVGLGVAVLVMLPWLAYNQSRFEDRALFSTNDGIALAGSNCDRAYYGTYIGYTDLRCLHPIPPGDQSEQSREWQSRAFDYVVDHKGRVPVVIAARLGRVWQVFDAFDNARFNVGEGRPVWGSVWGILTTWVLVPFAIGGIVVARRRRVVVWPLYVPVAIVTLTAALVLGQPRYRAPAEPSLAVLGAIGAVALFAWVRSSRSRQSITSEASSSS